MPGRKPVGEWGVGGDPDDIGPRQRHAALLRDRRPPPGQLVQLAASPDPHYLRVRRQGGESIGAPMSRRAR
jgi:hypothetical protein